MSDHDSAAPMLRTPLYDLHVSLGARMVPFAGYEMPVQYPEGILREHNHTRSQAGLFDVSHMGQVMLVGPDAAAALESQVPVDIVDLPVGMQRYALFLNDQGGVMADDVEDAIGLSALRGRDHHERVVGAAEHLDLGHLVERTLERDEVGREVRITWTRSAVARRVDDVTGGPLVRRRARDRRQQGRGPIEELCPRLAV